MKMRSQSYILLHEEWCRSSPMDSAFHHKSYAQRGEKNSLALPGLRLQSPMLHHFAHINFQSQFLQYGKCMTTHKRWILDFSLVLIKVD